MGVFRDLKDQKFSRLICIERVGSDKHKNALWLCGCECGANTTVVSRDLINGHTTSCGCVQREKVTSKNITHGFSKTRLYSIWQNMKRRCYSPNIIAYKDYGGRGITVCDEWQEFESFYNWAINSGYAEKLTIERVLVNGNYEPSNCTWIPKSDQTRNSRRNIFVNREGDTKILQDWANEFNINRGTLNGRIRMGWSVERSLTTPVRKLRRHNAS